MKNLKIHFWDSLTSHPERASFRNALTPLGIKTSTDIADLTGVNLLFIHGADSAGLNSYTFQANVFKVSFGDNATELKPIFIDENRISYINADELTERFDKIHEGLKDVSNLTIERLYEIVFGFAPHLEAKIKLKNALQNSENITDIKTFLENNNTPADVVAQLDGLQTEVNKFLPHKDKDILSDERINTFNSLLSALKLEE